MIKTVYIYGNINKKITTICITCISIISVVYNADAIDRRRHIGHVFGPDS